MMKLNDRFLIQGFSCKLICILPQMGDPCNLVVFDEEPKTLQDSLFFYTNSEAKESLQEILNLASRLYPNSCFYWAKSSEITSVNYSINDLTLLLSNELSLSEISL